MGTFSLSRRRTRRPEFLSRSQLWNNRSRQFSAIPRTFEATFTHDFLTVESACEREIEFRISEKARPTAELVDIGDKN